jgi:hypothetical protein
MAGLEAFYGTIMTARETAAAPTGMADSGFRDHGTAAAAGRFAWCPVGALPEHIVRETLGQHVDVQVLGDALVISVQAGGGMAQWQREALRDTTQYLTVVFNGQHHVEVPFHYDGSESWTAASVALPEGLSIDDITACEVEKDGRLLFSASMALRRGAQAQKINLVRFTLLDGLVGWALSDDNPDQELFGTAVIAGEQNIFCTRGRWEQERMRKFGVAVEAPPDTLLPVSLQLLSGAEAQRSPVWVFKTAASGFLIANPRLEGETLLFTILGEATRGALVDRIADSDHPGRVWPVDRPDAEPFVYLERHNTVGLPVSTIRNGARLELRNHSGTSLGHLPPLGDLLRAAGMPAA